MKLNLIRNHITKDGVFGELTCEGSNFKLYTLEHAYLIPEKAIYAPKLKAGAYLCKRGPHKLHGMVNSFETFEITGVEGHQGILFHVGNYNKDSEGCVLLGTGVDLNCRAIYGSKDGFEKFMDLLVTRESFDLVVSDV